MSLGISRSLANENILKLLLKFSLPAIIAMIVGALYNVIDRIYIGHSVAGTFGIAGITICMPIMLIIWAFGTLIGVGASALFSLKLGEDKKDEAKKIVGNGLTLLIIVSILVTLVGELFLDSILKMFGATNDILPFARDYMAIIFWGTILMLIGYGMSNLIRAEGKPQKAMLFMIIGPILNVLIAPLFIFTFNLGMKGAALATVVSQAVSTLLVLRYFLGKGSSFKVSIESLFLKSQFASKIIILGLAPFLMQIVSSIVTLILNRSLIKYGGDEAIPAMGIIMSIQALITMSIMGINQGMQPIVGFNYGSQNFSRVKKTLTYSIVIATLIATVSYILLQLFSKQIIMGFNDQNPDIISFGEHAIRVYLFLLPVIGLQVIGSGFFQAIGKAKQAMILSLSRQILIFIPLLLILPLFLNVEGIFISGIVADLGAFLLTAMLLKVEFRRLTLGEVITEKNINEGKY